MHLVLTGGTGSVGFGVLQYCLASNQVTKLSILSRRDFELPTAPNFDTSKARVIVHKDYTSYPADLLEELKGAQGLVWAQGISQSQVNREEYIRITYDYPMAAAKAFANLGDGKHFNFVYVSGQGADMEEKAWTLFGKIKGRAEKHLLELPASSPAYSALRVFNVRPSFVDPGPNAAVAPGATPPPIDAALWLIRPIFKNLAPMHYSPTNELSRVLVDLALSDGERLKDAPGIEAGGRLVRAPACRTKKWESIFHAGRVQHSDL